MKSVRGNIFTAEGIFRFGEVIVEDNRIEKIKWLYREELSSEEQAVRILPGLVDIHLHGAAGWDVCNCDDKHMREVVEYEIRNGITSMCFATMTLPVEKLEAICKGIAVCSERNPQLKGIYLEGPFISKEKAGAQNTEHILKPDLVLFERLMKSSDNKIRVVTVAPEEEGAEDFIKQLCEDEKCIVSIAHSAANGSQAQRAFDAGACHVTHLFNGMNAMTHREPGVAGVAADLDSVTVELICDGLHIDPIMIRNTYKLFGQDRVILISDSMEATGMKDGEYLLGDSAVTKRGQRAELSDGTLAGSVSNLYQCMTNAISYGVDEKTAILSATRNPAMRIGIYDEVGSIEIGKMADLLVVDNEYRLLKVIQNESDIH